MILFCASVKRVIDSVYLQCERARARDEHVCRSACAKQNESLKYRSGQNDKWAKRTLSLKKLPSING